MQAWPMRVLGALHISFVVLGAFYATSMFHMRWNKWPGSPVYQDWAVFLALSIISILLILYLGHLGIRLIKKDAEALWRSCLLFLGEIAFFAAVLYITSSLVPDSMTTVASGFWGMALNPLLPQFVTGYPLVGLVIAMVILLIRRNPPSTY
jgi:hypothetical protein